MRTLILVALLAVSLLIPAAASAGPVSGPQAKAHITKRLQYSKKVPDKTRPFRTQLGGKKGDRLRPFVASNMRAMLIPVPGGRLGGGRIHVGNRVTGTLNTETGAVRTKSVMMPR